jgi:hypothetical protein
MVKCGFIFILLDTILLIGIIIYIQTKNILLFLVKYTIKMT